MMMGRLLRWVQNNPFLVSLSVALVSTALLCSNEMAPEIIPLGDGEGYARGAFQLRGFLYSGQWDKFFDLLLSPHIYAFPPVYPLFLLIPSSLANIQVYGLINCLSWNVLLAIGIHGMLTALGRPGLSPAVMLLSVANNYALTQHFYFHLDLPFMSCGIIVVWLQVLAWRKMKPPFSILAGGVCGCMFLVKPGNGLVFLFTWVLAEVLYFCWTVGKAQRVQRRVVVLFLVRHAGFALAGLVPVMLLAAYWGSFQKIVGLMYANQLSTTFVTNLNLPPFLRMFYFPLCLSYFYSFLLIVPLITWALLRRRPASLKAKVTTRIDPQLAGFLFALVGSYLIAWGLLFSFVMTAKVTRSLLIMLPVGWITFFVSPLFCNWRASTLTWIACAYFAAVQIQCFSGFFAQELAKPDDYQLEANWWNRLPPKRLFSRDLTGKLSREVVQHLSKMGLERGKIGVGSARMYWDTTTLNWFAQSKDFLAGKSPDIRFVSYCNSKGELLKAGVEGVQGFVLIVEPSFPYSPGVYRLNATTAEYGWEHWRGKLGEVVYVYSDSISKQKPNPSPVCVLILLKKPLEGELLASYVRKVSPDGFSKILPSVDRLNLERLSISECFEILVSMLKRHFSAEGQPASTSRQEN